MGKKVRARGVHTAVVLPPEVLEQLRKSERGVSEEIRRRITLTFEQDAADPMMREICDFLPRVAEKLRRDYGTDWHSWYKAHAAFVAAVVDRLSEYAPPAHEPETAIEVLYRPNPISGPPIEPPETLGRVRERDDRHEHSYPNLEAAQARRAGKKVGHLARHIGAKKGEGDE